MSTETSVLWEESLPGGSIWSHVFKRGTSLRITDTEGGANVSVLFYNADNFVERYNMPDTLKCQHTAHLTQGHCLYSDMGRVLASITHDDLGWHDPLAGFSNKAIVARQFGEGTYQALRNGWHTNAHDLILVELAKYGMNERDFTASVNLFSKVVVEDDGSFRYVEGHSPAGSTVELRSDMNTLMILCTCPHPLAPGGAWAPKPVGLTVKRVPLPSLHDPCRLSRPENGRGFTLTERYFL
jgi:uncharacterized protein